MGQWVSVCIKDEHRWELEHDLKNIYQKVNIYLGFFLNCLRVMVFNAFFNIISVTGISWLSLYPSCPSFHEKIDLALRSFYYFQISTNRIKQPYIFKTDKCDWIHYYILCIACEIFFLQWNRATIWHQYVCNEELQCITAKSWPCLQSTIKCLWFELET